MPAPTRLLARAALALVLAAPATASEYADGWGPPVGTTIPEASFQDQAGQPQTLAGLMGARGILVFFGPDHPTHGIVHPGVMWIDASRTIRYKAAMPPGGGRADVGELLKAIAP